MAYIDHASAFSAGIGQQIPTSWVMEDAPRTDFSPIEWTVIALARKDRIASLSEPGPLARAFGGLFGLGRQSMLADPALESLRRFAVHAWHKGYQLPVSEMKRFLAAGFSAGQLELALSSISMKRVAR